MVNPLVLPEHLGRGDSGVAPHRLAGGHLVSRSPVILQRDFRPVRVTAGRPHAPVCARAACSACLRPGCPLSARAQPAATTALIELGAARAADRIGTTQAVHTGDPAGNGEVAHHGGQGIGGRRGAVLPGVVSRATGRAARRRLDPVQPDDPIAQSQGAAIDHRDLGWLGDRLLRGRLAAAAARHDAAAWRATRPSRPSGRRRAALPVPSRLGGGMPNEKSVAAGRSARQDISSDVSHADAAGWPPGQARNRDE